MRNINLRRFIFVAQKGTAQETSHQVIVWGYYWGSSTCTSYLDTIEAPKWPLQDLQYSKELWSCCNHGSTDGNLDSILQCLECGPQRIIPTNLSYEPIFYNELFKSSTSIVRNISKVDVFNPKRKGNEFFESLNQGKQPNYCPEVCARFFFFLHQT